jgi:hypothetical protein
MSEAAERVEAWRRAKRKDGLRPVTLWLSLECKRELDTLAFQRRQDVSACVVEAVHHFAVSQGARTAPRLGEQDLHWLKDEIYAEVVRRLAHPETEAQAPPSPPARRGVGERTEPTSPQTLARILAAREEYPDLPWPAFAQHLFDAGIYQARQRRTGRPVPIDRHFLVELVKRAQRLEGRS